MKAIHTFVAALFLTLLAGDAWAQHQGHQVTAAAVPAAGGNPDCAQAGQNALAIVEAAGMRLDTAGGAKSGADLQVAVAQAQMAVAAAQAELFTCRAAVPTLTLVTPPPAEMAGMDHSKMNMGTPASDAKPVAPGAKPAGGMAGMDHSKMNTGTPASGTKPAAPGAKPAGAMAGMDHSKMNMGTPASGPKPAAPGAKPVGAMAGMDHSKMNMTKPAAGAKAAAQGAHAAAPQQAAPMAGMDHSKMAMGGAAAKPGDMPSAVGGEAKLPVMMAERIADPACAGNLGHATAPKAVFERKVYYFCSSAARDAFRKDPAAYLKKHPR